MSQSRMESRKAHFKIGLVGRQSYQEKRRLEHLEIQRKRRSNAFDSIRGIDDLADCFLNDDELEEEGRYDDPIEEEVEMERLNGAPNKTKKSCHIDEANSKIESNSTMNKINNHRYLKYRDRCMRAEFLELSEGLPCSFDQDWILVGPIPRGKRCLALTFSNNQNRSNFNVESFNQNSNMATLFSRKNANKIGIFLTLLPKDCILDCIYDQSNQTLWILDILKWKNQAMIDCEAHFRFWWRNAKLSELGTQSLPDSTTLLCTPIPVLFNFSKSQVAKITRGMMDSSVLSQEMKILSHSNQDHIPRSIVHRIEYECEGLIFYIKSSTYESGQSVLAGWVPLDVEDKDSNDHGIAKLNWLCERENDVMEE